ncbi:hypothetical protein P3T21_007237 [Paraburkholderia sp. GAS334]
MLNSCPAIFRSLAWQLAHNPFPYPTVPQSCRLGVPGKLQPLKNDRVVVLDKGHFLQQCLGLLERFLGIVCQYPLIEVGRRSERWAIPEKHVDEFQFLDTGGNRQNDAGGLKGVDDWR